MCAQSQGGTASAHMFADALDPWIRRMIHELGITEMAHTMQGGGSDHHHHESPTTVTTTTNNRKRKREQDSPQRIIDDVDSATVAAFMAS